MPGSSSIGSPLNSPLKFSNISELVQKVAWIGRRRADNIKPWEQGSAMYFADSHSVTDGLASNGSSGLATPSREADGVEVSSQIYQPSQFSDPYLLAVKVHVMETLISNIYTTVSSLKNSYMQLQAAHTPYDPEKLQIADKAVIAELKRLSELKHYYRERLAAITSVEPRGLSMLAEEQQKVAFLKSYEGIISNFHGELHKKNAEVESLKETLAQTTLKKEKLERRVKRLEQKPAKDSFVKISNDVSPTPELLESVVLAASESVRSFAKLLIHLMKSAQWDLDAASNSIEPDINYTRNSHRKYAFESFVCLRMFSGFENENFSTAGTIPSVLDADKHRHERFSEFQVMRTVDALEFVSMNQDCLFGKFCLAKFLHVVHPKMEEYFFGNFEHRNQVTSGSHPRSQFYQSYLRVAKAIWLLHRLAFSFEPTASVFQVRKGTDFAPLYMESVVQNVEIQNSGYSSSPKVGFTVIPGFRVGRAIIKCQVYATAAKVEQ